MTRRLLIATLVSIASLALMGRPASATTITGNAVSTTRSGTWHVTISETSPQHYAFTMKANSGSEEPETDVVKVEITFLNEGNEEINVLTSMGGVDAAGTNWHVASTILRSRLFAADPSNYLRKDGSNRLAGTTEIVSGIAVHKIRVQLFDQNHHFWTLEQEVGLVPEPGSLALVLPGLAPLGLMLVRRRGAGMPRETDEDTNLDPEPEQA